MNTNRALLFLVSLLSLCPVRIQAQEPEVSTDRTAYLPNEPVAVRFNNGPGFLQDWVGLYAENAASGSFIVWQFMDGSQTGKVPLSSGQTVFVKGPPKAGAYEVRMYENNLYVELARSEFVVTNAPRLQLSQKTALPGVELRMAFTNCPGNPKDAIVLQLADAPSSEVIARLYLDGTANGEVGRTNGAVTFVTPQASGIYVARLTLAGATEPADAVTIAVGYPAPLVTAEYDASSVTLKWTAPQWPIAIQRYEVLGRARNASPTDKLGEIAAGTGTLSFKHSDLAPGSERCYWVRAVGAEGSAASTSAPICIAPAALEAEARIAYDVTAGTIGNQAWNGALGMEFEIVNAITVSHLGVFDDGGNGLKRNLLAKLYDRTLRKEVTRLEFTPASEGFLVGGSRFKPLTEPIRLPSGFKGVIVVEGYGLDEMAGNTGISPLSLKTNDGNGAVLFVGKARYGRAGFYPGTVDAGPVNRYAAGSFQFRVAEVTAPGKPALTTIPDDRSVLLSWPAVTQPLPAAKYQVSRSSGPNGTFIQIAEITATEYRDAGLPNGADVCYKVRAITAEGVAGPDSDTSCQTPDVVQPGIAYINPAELEGNQTYGGSVGNDFDVLRPIQVTRLGAFDDLSDGLKRTITVRLYNRATEQEVAKLQFAPSDPGELIQGSRFKNLVAPVTLFLGFQGAIVASGYGENERDGNEGIPGTVDLNLAMFSGGCLRFVGTSRWGDDPDAYPGIADGGPENRYAAGTFRFEPLSLDPPPALSIRVASSGLVIDWKGGGVLESVGAVGGTWQVVTGASPGLTIQPEGAARFYRVRR